MNVCRVTVTFNTCIVTLACLLTSSLWLVSEIYLIVLLSIVVHELGHVLGLLCSRNVPNRLYISSLYAYVMIKANVKLSKTQDYAFILGGPLATLVLFVTGTLLQSNLLTAINFVLFLQSVYPTKGSDGYEFCMSIIKHNTLLKNIELVTIVRLVILLIVCGLCQLTISPAINMLVHASALYLSVKFITGV